MALHRLFLSALLAGLVIACGGGGNGDSDDPFSDLGGATATPGSDGDTSGPGSGGAPGSEIEFTANAGEAWAEVDGETLVYTAGGSLHYICDISDESIQVNFQTADGHDLLIQARRPGTTWAGSITFKPGRGDAQNTQFSAFLPADADHLGVAGGMFSFRGTVQRVENFDLGNARELDARIAVNCASAGGDPSATIDGETYVFPFSGAQNVECEISEDSIHVLINRLSREDLQLQIDVRRESGSWSGQVAVFTPTGALTSIPPDDGEGLVIEGASLTYTGVFATGHSGLDGTVSVACP